MEEPTLSVIERDEIILDPNMSAVETIGTMARLCYKTEPKEGEDVEAVNERIIKNCIKNGHESILEHGAISMYLSKDITKDAETLSNIFCSEPVSFLSMWNYEPTDASDKYLYPFIDPELYGKWIMKKNPENKEQTAMKMLNVILGDIHAWRLVLREKMMVALSHDNGYLFLLTLRVLKEMYGVSKVLFQDIMDEFNTKLCNEKFFKATEGSRIAQAVLTSFDPSTCSVDAIVDKYFVDNDSIFADEATKCAKVSVIITTDRATTHQLVRHRKDVAYSQESQRYVNYDKKGYRVIGLTVDPKFGKKEDGTGLPIDPATGLIDKDSDIYKAWFKAMQSAFASYQELLAHNLPPESARGVLPNDTATKIGVTWLRPNSFMNVVFWRLDSHAQYAIRSMICRIILKLVEMKHPFMNNIPFGLAKQWGATMKQQNLLNDPARIDKFIADREALEQAVADYIQSQKEVAEQSAQGEGEAAKQE